MKKTAEDRALELLIAYRAAWASLHDEEVNKDSEFWYENGRFYIWPAIRLDNGIVVKNGSRPLIVRGSQLPGMIKTLRLRKEMQDAQAAYDQPGGDKASEDNTV